MCKCAKLLERLSDAIRDHVFEAQAIFMDDTTVKLLQKGKVKLAADAAGYAYLRPMLGVGYPG